MLAQPPRVPGLNSDAMSNPALVDGTGSSSGPRRARIPGARTSGGRRIGGLRPPGVENSKVSERGGSSEEVKVRWYVLAAAVTGLRSVGEHLVGTREEHRRRRFRLDAEVVEHRSQEPDTSSQTVAVEELEMRRDRQTVGALGVRRCGLASLDALQRAAEPTDREQLLAEAKAGVHQLGPDVFDVGIDSCHRRKVLDGFATPERDRVLERVEGVGSGRSGELAAPRDETAELPEIDIDAGRASE